MRNTAAWVEVSKEAAFPDDPNGACFTCKSFYTSASRIVLIPSAEMGLGDAPSPVADLTKSIGLPVIKVNVVKYASLLRGDKSCKRHGSLAISFNES